MRLACPEYDVVGLAVPGVPGLAHSGHTGTAAWAVTHAMADSQDLYPERLRHRKDGRIEGPRPRRRVGASRSPARTRSRWRCRRPRAAP
ncbi:penicillin acylase family protein [Streptomyces sp. 4.24]|uniref:penicillin acylase family protein n=1 Tax=Streptomyces tritrimontium TaxID=3406573 RepID=UPI003BB714AF